MAKILKLLNKYWLIVSVASTLITSLATLAWQFHSRLSADETKLAETNDWVSSHDDDLQALHDDVNKLKEDERLREGGLCK